MHALQTRLLVADDDRRSSNAALGVDEQAHLHERIPRALRIPVQRNVRRPIAVLATTVRDVVV